MEELDSSARGLTTEQAKLRVGEYGRNELPQAPPKPAILRFLAQFDDVLIYILLVAAVLKAIIGDWAEFGIIGVAAFAIKSGAQDPDCARAAEQGPGRRHDGGRGERCSLDSHVRIWPQTEQRRPPRSLDPGAPGSTDKGPLGAHPGAASGCLAEPSLGARRPQNPAEVIGELVGWVGSLSLGLVVGPCWRVWSVPWDRVSLLRSGVAQLLVLRSP